MKPADFIFIGAGGWTTLEAHAYPGEIILAASSSSPGREDETVFLTLPAKDAAALAEVLLRSQRTGDE